MALKLDKLDEQNQGEIRQPTLVLCEGKGDASFILHLAENRGINGIQVGFPDPVVSNQYGKDGFKEYLAKLRPRVGFTTILRRIAIVRDRNGSDKVAFQEVLRQITDAGGYDVPEALDQETTGTPSITVRLIPDTATEGNLEVLLLNAIDPNHLNKHCYDSYFECCNLERMQVGKAAKIKLTTIIAASCQSNPSCSLVNVWSTLGNPIPLDSHIFDNIAAFLRRVTTA